MNVELALFFPEDASIAEELVGALKICEVRLSFPRVLAVIVVVKPVRMEVVEVVSHHEAIGLEFVGC